MSILVTGFAPFAGRGINGSSTLASALDGLMIGPHQIHARYLAVRWGEPQDRLSSLLDELNPILAIGLGEGTKDHIELEQRAVNSAAGMDEHEQEAPAALDPNGPQDRRSLLRLPAPDDSWACKVAVSENAGVYLCNNLLYHGLGLLPTCFGFVHLPIQGDEPSEVYAAKLVPPLRAIIATNLPLDQSKPV